MKTFRQFFSVTDLRSTPAEQCSFQNSLTEGNLKGSEGNRRKISADQQIDTAHLRKISELKSKINLLIE